MRDSSDMELVREYARHNADAAFAELVHRHVNLVYSVALRHIAIAAQAEEITQAVFVTLARKAAGLRPDTVLAAWLYETARLTAISFLRGERRRQFREQEAYMQSTLEAAPTDSAWQQLAPLLDDAMMWLGRKDREAVVLRFFKDKDLREVAAALNINEAAAQKRVNRAVEKLRTFFAKRGVTTSSAALAVVLGANAVQAAPVGLAVTISTAAALAGTTLATTATATAIKAIAMTTLQKTLVTATIVAAVGTAIYEVRQASTLRSQVQTFQQQQSPLAEQIEQLTKDRDEATRRLAALSDENERLNRNTAELSRLRGKIGLLQQALASRPQPPNANASWRVGTPRRLEEMCDVGQATPEAVLQTTIWAAIANPHRLLDLVHLPAPDAADPERLERMRQGMVDLYKNVDWGLAKEFTIERLDYSKQKHFDLVKDAAGNTLQHAGEFADYVEVYIDYPGYKEVAADQENPPPGLLPTHWRITRVG